MFTVKDLSVGDLCASYRMTITHIGALPARIWDKELFAVDGIEWDNGAERHIVTLEDTPVEVWE